MLLTAVLGLLTLFAAYVTWAILSMYRTAAKLPPGPTPIPFFGSIFKDLHPPMLHLDLERLAKQFGSIFTIHFPFPVINVCDFETLKDAMIGHGDDFSGRMPSAIADMVSYTPNGGITLANGDSWKTQRRTAISILRDFGMGKNLMEEKVRLSTIEYLKYLKTQDLDRCDLHVPLHLFVANVIIEILFGFRHTYDNCSGLMQFVRNLQTLFDDVAHSSLFFMMMKFPWLRHVPVVKYYAYDIHKENWDKLQQYIVKEVDRAIAEPDESEEPGTFVHAYRRKGLENPSLTYPQLVNCCTNLFIAGQESTSTTLRWATLFMAAHPEIQEKVRTEIFKVIGKDRLPSLNDRPHMPYTIATLHEVQRVGNILTVIFHNMRRAAVDTKIGDFKVPKGTMVNCDLHQIMACDPHFVNPKQFNPDRYLEEDGVTFKKDLVDRTIPFGIGKRQCAGEGLARVELFIGLTSTLQAYRLLPPLDGPVDLEPIYLNAHFPKPHKLRLVPVE